MNKKVWMLRGQIVSGPYLFKSKERGWVYLYDHDWCARPSEVFNTEKEAFEKLIRNIERHIVSLQRRKLKVEDHIKNKLIKCQR